MDLIYSSKIGKNAKEKNTYSSYTGYYHDKSIKIKTKSEAYLNP